VHAADPVVSFHSPALHALHALPSTPVYPVLHVHAPTALLPCPDTLFDGQDSHTADEVAANVVEYLSSPHRLQSAGPEVSLYFPATQPLQAIAPPPPVYPALQIHAFTSVLPIPLVIVVALQASQAWLPRVDLYVLATHCVHEPPFGPVHPATHWQLVRAVLCTSESVFAGQLEHAVCPVFAANFPVAHCVHGPPAGPKNPALHRQAAFAVDPIGD